jgi:fumarate hydratase class I
MDMCIDFLTGCGDWNQGGPAALLAKENIKKVDLLEYPELGMEAIYKIEVEDFPAFILVDDKGNDFFQQLPCSA